MNPHASSPHPNRNDPYGAAARAYREDQLWGRLHQPGVLVPALLLLLTVAYQATSSIAARRRGGRPLPPPAELLWHALVWLLPARLLYAVDGWMNPAVFPRSMLQGAPGSTVSLPGTHAAKSDVLRKILGMDAPGGIMASVSQAGRRSLSSISGGAAALAFKGDASQPPGLGNWDNSCYQNSILQGLASLKTLPRYLASPAAAAADDDGRRSPRTDTAETLRALIADLTDGSNNGRTLWTPAVLKNMSTWQQQDAQEYYSKLLDEIDREVAKAAKAAQRGPGLETEPPAPPPPPPPPPSSSSWPLPARDDGAASQHSDDSGYQSQSSLSSSSSSSATPSKAGSELLRAARNPLEGLTAQRVACVACGHSDGLSMVPFNCLTLDLAVGRPEHDLYERLDAYTRVEPIPGVECAKCTLLKFQKLIRTIIARSRAAGARDAEFPEPFARLAAIEAALEEDAFDDAALSRQCKIPAAQRVSATKTKQVVVARPPQSLALHVNRSVFDEATGAMYKNLAAVRYPKLLDLGPWCLGSAATTAAASRASITHDRAVATDTEEPVGAVGATDEEQWLLDPLASMVAGGGAASKIAGPIYELRAVVTHYGRHENGHYVCYRKHPRTWPRHDKSAPVAEEEEEEEKTRKTRMPEQPANLAAGEHEHEHDKQDEIAGAPAEDGGPHEKSQPLAEAGGGEDGDEKQEEEEEGQWWRLSDQEVTRVDEDMVLSQGGAFMLFYDCVDPNSVLVTAPVDAVQEEAEDKEKEKEKEAGGDLAEQEDSPPAHGGDMTAEEALRKAQAVPLPVGGEDGL